MKKFILALMTVAVVSVFGIYAYQVNAAESTSNSSTAPSKVEAKTTVKTLEQAEKVVAVATSKPSVAMWDVTTHNFGDIPHNVPAKAQFEVTNNSELPFFIESAKGSCGCTVPTYSQDPILPGESTTIEATYNAKKVGNFSKTVTVKLSTQDQVERLVVKGTVLEANI